MITKTSHTPAFNMKVVVQETGLKPVTLRAWERRYGMPNPHRTEGGHRLYTQYEINTLKWLLARQNEGMSIKNAVERWQQLQNEGQDPLELQPPATNNTPQNSITYTEIGGDQVQQLRTAWIDACLAFDEHGAQHTLAKAFALFPTDTVCFNILQQGLAIIGQGWYEGHISVPQEHFASALAIRKLESLLSALSLAPRHEGRILIGCPPAEQHTFSPLLLTLQLRQRGWDVVYLGASIPVARLETAVRTIQPKLVIMSAQTLHTAGTLISLAHLLNGLSVRMAFGGGVFNAIPDTRQYIPGYFLSEQLQDAPNQVNALVSNPPPLEPAKRPSAAYQHALNHYQEQRSAIDATVHEQHIQGSVTPTELKNANNDLGNNIIAALTLGSMDLLTANIDWIRGLLINYHYRMPEEALSAYLHTYCQALQAKLDARGEPILAWFQDLLTK